MYNSKRYVLSRALLKVHVEKACWLILFGVNKIIDIAIKKLCIIFKLVNSLVSNFLSAICPTTLAARSKYRLRGNNNRIVPYARTERFLKRYFSISSVRLSGISIISLLFSVQKFLIDSKCFL